MAKFLLIFLTLWASSVYAEDAVGKKKILILSSMGGGGHRAAAMTLDALVGSEYDCRVIYPIDQLRILGIPSGEQIYNSMLRRGWIRSMNFVCRHVAPKIFRSRTQKLEKMLATYIETLQPDLVISLIPFVNYPASEAARKANIPYLLITTDNDLRNWAVGISRITHPHFKVTIGTDLPTTRQLLVSKNIPESAIETIGLPLRPDFIKEKDPQKIREELGLPSCKQIILITMGGAGGDSAYEYARKIGSQNLSAHLVILAGHNARLKRDLEYLELHPGNSMTVFGYTDRVADLMAVSSVVITKPGPGTINEAMAMRLPLLIDNTGTSLFWERANVDLVIGYGIGQKVKEFHQIGDLLKSYLWDDGFKEQIARSFVTLPKNDFHRRIPQLIREMISLREETLLVTMQSD
ncbi:MAG: hypothetical protein JSS61_04440 [Verrucomicrobia bacterium]|nr:hypothetical protein [Verrucomicrobiota bacterium]